MPYLSCPICRLTHYEAATAIVTERTCPRCRHKRGVEAAMIESPTLPDARQALARMAAIEGLTADSGGGPSVTAY